MPTDAASRRRRETAMGNQRVRWSETLSQDAASSASSSGGSQPSHKNSQPPLPLLYQQEPRRSSSSRRGHRHTSSKYHRDRVARSLDGSSVESSVFSQVSMSSDTNNNKGGEAWRKHGKLFRAQLLMADEEQGGNTFVLSQKCRIAKYYDIAEKVLDQFLQTSVDESKDLTESYLVGNRLVKFLSTVLPTHPAYFSNDPLLVQKRSKSQAQLVQLLQYLEQLALIIDEYELNKYILNDLQRKPAKKSYKNKMISLPDTSLSSGEALDVFHDYSISSNDEGDSVFDAKNKEFVKARDSHVRQQQGDDASSWDSSFSPFASHHHEQQPRGVAESRTKDPPRAAEQTLNQQRNRTPAPRSMAPASNDWTASFPVSFPEKQDFGESQSLSTKSFSTRGSAQEAALYSTWLSGGPSPPPRKSRSAKQNLQPMHPTITREQSPKSTMDLLQWTPAQGETFPRMAGQPVKGYLPFDLEELPRPPDGDDEASALTAEEEELSLTDGRPRRKQVIGLHQFKGCIKCLLE